MQIVAVSGALIPLIGNFKPKIEDIAHSLSQINRFTGHTYFPYTVAQHSVLVSQYCPPHLAFQGLLHDAHEAYCSDLPSPHKEVIDHLGDNAWSKFEGRIAGIVRRHFSIPVSFDKRIKETDNLLYQNEVGSLFNDEAKRAFMALGCVPKYDIKIAQLSTQQAYDLFLNRFFELSNGAI